MKPKKRGEKLKDKKDQPHLGDKKTSSFKKFGKPANGSFKKPDKALNERSSDNSGEKRTFNSYAKGKTAPKTTFRKFDNDKKDRFPGKPEKPDGERRAYNSNFSRSRNGDMPSRPPFKKFDKPRFEGKSDRPYQTRREDGESRERKPYNPDFNKSRGGDIPSRPPFKKFDKPRFEGNSDRPYQTKREDGESRERRPYNPDFNKSRGGDIPSRPPFKKFDKAPFEGNSDRRPRRNDGDRRPYNSDRPQTRREDNDNRERRPYGRDANRPADRSDARPPFKKFGDKNSPNSRDRQVGLKRAPRYDEESLKRKAPFKVREKFKKKREDEEVRLNRYIANSGLCSRREADELIASGMIKVNGKVMTEMGYKVQENDTIKYGKNILSRERMMYVLLNKPKDYITTMDDPNDRKTVMDLVGEACRERIYPVGRLDRNTTGLLLLTNDGELTEKLTHPSSNIKKVYQAELDKPFSEEHFEALRNGIELEDGFIKPDQVAFVTPDAEVIGLEIHSGKNRIVRRIFEHLGYEVTKLDRTTFAGLNKKDLPRGKWRFLSEKEVIMLKYLA